MTAVVALLVGGVVMMLPARSRVTRGAWTLTILGGGVPIALVAEAALSTHARWDLLVIAVIVGVVGPASGHIVARRRVFTRGHLVRIGATGLAGACLLVARSSHELGGALGAGMFAFATLTLGFVIGVVMDVVELDRWFTHGERTARTRR